MIRRKMILVAAAATLALSAASDAANVAVAGYDSGNAAYCHWFKQKAMQTRDEYWWDRWRRCMRGDFWD
jgi:hypothetical protein